MLTARVFALAAALGLSACSLNPFSDSFDPDKGFLLGKNLVGEDCRAVPNAQEARILGAESAYDIRCGQWEAPSATLSVYDASLLDEGTDPAPWLNALADIAQCADLQETVRWPGGTGRLFNCSFRRGSQWPYEARMLQSGNRLYGIQGIPAAMPPAEFAAALLTGNARPGDRPSQSALDQTARDFEARLGTRLFSVGDVFAFVEVMEYAQYLNSQELHADALNQYQRALVLQQRVLPGDDPRLAEVLMTLALENSNLERFGQADLLFNRAAVLTREAIDPNLQARLISYQAFHLANQRKFNDALRAARQANTIREEIVDSYLRGSSDGSDNRFASLDEGNIGLGGTYGLTALADLMQSRYLEGAMLRNLGLPNQATMVANRAELAVSQYPLLGRDWRQKLRLLRAELAEEAGNLGEARSILGQVIAEERSRAVDSYLQALALIERGRLAFAEQDVPSGFADTEQGLAIIERAQQDLPVESLVPYYDAVLANATPERQISAFGYAQLVRSPIVAQTMRQSYARLAASDSEGGRAIRYLQDLRRYRDNVTEELALARAEGLALRAEVLERTLTKTENQLKGQERTVQAALPRYNLIVDAPVPAQRLQESLRDREGIILFQVAENRSYGFLVTRNQTTLFPIAVGRAELKDLIETLRFSIDERPGARYDLAIAARAHDILFGPIRNQMAALGQIVIAPTGLLQSLPFSMLVKSHDGSASTAYDRADWLIRSHGVAVVPSIQAFHLNRTGSRPSRSPVPFAGFVGGSYAGETGANAARRLNLPANCEGDLAALLDLPPLAGTATEVNLIAERIGRAQSQTFTLGQLSENALKALPLDDYRVVHFATHGLFPGELDCLPQPALVVGLPESGSREDGLLTAAEIINLSLNADLVVLSACNTGIVLDEFGGESMASLSRSFFYAGAKGLLVSHWYVSDDATQTLMVGIFDRLKQGMSPVEAVRQAKLAMIANPQTSHPYLWSAFTYLGDGASPIAL